MRLQVSTVYSCSIDTIFLCAFKDIKENGDAPKYLSNDLRRAFGFDKAGAAEAFPLKGGGKVRTDSNPIQPGARFSVRDRLRVRGSGPGHPVASLSRTVPRHKHAGPTPQDPRPKTPTPRPKTPSPSPYARARSPCPAPRTPPQGSPSSPVAQVAPAPRGDSVRPFAREGSGLAD